MANTSWFKGVEDTPAPGGQQIPLANHVFVDGAFVGVSDGSPDASYKNILNARITESGQKTFVLSDSTFTDTGITFESGDIIEGNNKATIDGSGTFNNSGNKITIRNCTITGYNLGTGGVELINCYVENCTGSGEITLTNTTTKDCTWTINQNSSHNYITTENQQSTCTAIITVQNSDLSTDSQYTVSSGSVTISFSNNRMTVQAGITDGGNNIDDDPLHIGSIGNQEFIIESTSPLIGAGTNNSTIGAFTLGGLLDFTGATLDNITVGATINITTGNWGRADLTEVTLSQINKSPRFIPNGLFSDGLDVPNLQDARKSPNRLTYELTWRETVSGSQQTKVFIFGLPTFIDNSGRSTGEDNFNYSDISSDGDLLNNPDNLTSANLIDVAEYIIRIELRNTRQSLTFGGESGNQAYIDTSGYTLNLGDGQSASNNFSSLFIYNKLSHNGVSGVTPFDFVCGADNGNQTLQHLSYGTAQQQSHRLVLLSGGRFTSVQGQGSFTNSPYMSGATPFDTNVGFCYQRITNDENQHFMYDADGVIWPNGAISGNMLQTDVFSISNLWYGRGYSGATGLISHTEMKLVLHVIAQPELTSAQCRWIMNPDQNNLPRGRFWEEIESQDAKDVGIGIDGVDVIGGSITTLVKLFVDFSDLNEDSGSWYVRERVSGNNTMGLLVNFSATATDDLVNW